MTGCQCCLVGCGFSCFWLVKCFASCPPYHFDLSAQEFRDALCLGYHRPLSLVSVRCDGCGEDFILTYAFDCCKGSLVTQLHSGIRDALGDLAALGYREVAREPLVSGAWDRHFSCTDC